MLGLHRWRTPYPAAWKNSSFNCIPFTWSCVHVAFRTSLSDVNLGLLFLITACIHEPFGVNPVLKKSLESDKSSCGKAERIKWASTPSNFRYKSYGLFYGYPFFAHAVLIHRESVRSTKFFFWFVV